MAILKNRMFYFLMSLEMGDYASRKYKNVITQEQVFLQPNITLVEQ